MSTRVTKLTPKHNTGHPDQNQFREVHLLYWSYRQSKASAQREVIVFTTGQQKLTK